MPLYMQSSLDSLCGIFSIVNAHRIISKCNQDDSQIIFNKIIEYLHKKKKLKETLLEGINHKLMQKIIYDVMQEDFKTIATNLKGFYNLKDWWQYSQNFLTEHERSSIILSLGGRAYHLTVISAMSEKSLFLMDSSEGAIRVSKRYCRLVGYTGQDRYIIYPSQCWYLT